MGGRAAHVPDAVTRTNSNEYWETRVNVVIHHNPECGTSRNVLSIIESAGYEPTIIEYLKTGWTKPQIGLVRCRRPHAQVSAPHQEITRRTTRAVGGDGGG